MTYVVVRTPKGVAVGVVTFTAKQEIDALMHIKQMRFEELSEGLGGEYIYSLILFITGEVPKPGEEYRWSDLKEPA